jgi:hypothetical protein
VRACSRKATRPMMSACARWNSSPVGSSTDCGASARQLAEPVLGPARFPVLAFPNSYKSGVSGA